MSSAVLERYERVLARFFDFENVNNEFFSTSAMDLDSGVCKYIESLWQDRKPKYWGEDVIRAFGKRIPQLRGGFPGAWQLISAWQRHELPKRCTPSARWL